MQFESHPMPPGRQTYDYSNLEGWQPLQCITVERKDAVRIKSYFVRVRGWKFREQKQPDGKVRLWRKA